MFNRCFTRARFLFRQRRSIFDDYTARTSQRTNRQRYQWGEHTAKPLLGLSAWGIIRETIGLDKVRLDEDPIKDQIKQSWLQRKYKNYDEAIRILEDVLTEVKEKGENSIEVTRVLDELANTYFFKGDWNLALDYFRAVVQRLIQFHHKNESSPEFIGISLKMAEILANKGEIDNAEIGYRHCITKQMEVVDKHFSKYFISNGAAVERGNKVDEFGQEYTDPIVLFAMCLQQFAHFIIEYRDQSREKEACDAMDEVLKLTYHVFGPNHPQLLHILNNFGAACVIRNRFETARKYLSVGIDKILYSPENTDIIVGYYCNYAESLFHTESFDEAVKYAESAVRMARTAPDNVRRYAETFLKQVKQDLRNARRKAASSHQQPSDSGWFSWLWGSSTKPEPATPSTSQTPPETAAATTAA
ncbi:unnamed protein product [Bursaphelenchus okinawaensis]|uniref:TPR_REGION domain-containing protein n=1 Tax=Bursaphelenchus okinawaensis TaxID=465554 RepID=A0A811K910_9BILA|nr:unnamed protein product [Bursaphelenchus okinawaensis]CAG9094508.1 unnamed protein product [Bursaphelenchus okinawaensis]